MVGTTISHYKILEKIGQGGMGEVFLAQDTTLDRKVALKFLPEELQQDSTARKRFLREARSAAALDHPYICHIHEVGEVEGQSFISMEYVQGETLKDKLAKGPLPLKDALEKATEVAEALEEAHKQGLVHRDLKPSNIMLTPQGHVKVMDFGLAKQVTPGEGQEQEITTALTRQGSTLGTVPYMSPEQVRGQVVDTRSDIFSFGVVLYEMLGGVNPFKRDTSVDTSHAILGEAPPPLTRYTEGIPVLLQHTVKKMLAKEPDERYQLVHDVRTDLGELMGEIEKEPTTTPPIGMTRAIQPALWRKALPWGAALVVAILAVGVFLWDSASPLTGRAARFVITPPPGESLDLRDDPNLAISPDGSIIAYFGERGGFVQLYVRAIDQLQATPLPDTENGHTPFFSPDGEWVGFFSDPDRTLRKVSLSGGSSLELCEASGGHLGASWSLNDTIVFSSLNSGLARVSALGGQPEALTTPDSEKGELRHQFPVVLPGGKEVLFTIRMGSDPEDTRTAVLSLETGEQKILFEGGNGVQYAPTGHLIYGRAGTLWAVPFDLARLETVGSSVPVLEDVMVNRDGPPSYSLSLDGSLVYVPGSVRAYDGTLVWKNREGEEVETFLEQPLEFPRDLRLSPDGRQVALITGGKSGPGELWLYDSGDRPSIRLVAEELSSVSPIWTPDGRQVVFASWRTDMRGLFSIAADGSTPDPKPLLSRPTPSLRPWSVSPDGEELIFQELNVDTERDIMAVKMKGEQELRAVVQTEHDETSPRLSSDGRWLAYASDVTGSTEVWVRPYPGPGAPSRISLNGGSRPVWGPRDEEIFYIQANQMMATKVSTAPEFQVEPPVVLFELPGTLLSGATVYSVYDVDSDGRFLMIKPTRENPGQINVVLNWFEELKRLVPTN